MKIATSLGYSIERNTKQMSNFDEEISLRVALFKDQLALKENIFKYNDKKLNADIL